MEFHHRKAKIFDDTGELIGSGERTRGNLFYLDLSEETCLFAQFDDVWFWHKRSCHVNFENLISISKKKKVRGLLRLKKPDNLMCKQCQLGKMTKCSFKSKTYTSENILELVHTDLCGPMGVQSYCGDRYFILFFDDYIRMMIVMFLKEKFDAFQLFKWYFAKVEKEIVEA